MLYEFIFEPAPRLRQHRRKVGFGSFTTVVSEHKVGPCPFSPDSDQIMQQTHMTQSAMNESRGFASVPNKGLPKGLGKRRLSHFPA